MLQDLIKRLELAVEEYKRSNDLSYYQLKAMPPATKEEIQKLEASLQLTLPPSYREFLLMHNGYTGLACPGSMLSITDLMPGSKLYAKINEWKQDTSGYGDNEVMNGLVFSDQAQPNDWAYLDPTKPSENGEWPVVLHLGGDPIEFDNLIDFLESRIKFCKY